MDQKNDQVFHFQFDDQTLESSLKIVIARILNGILRNKGITLFVHHRYPAGQAGGFTVFGTICMIMTEFLGNRFGLIELAAAIRSAIHLDQSKNIWLQRLDESNDLIKMTGCTVQIAAPREPGLPRTRCVPNIIK